MLTVARLIGGFLALVLLVSIVSMATEQPVVRLSVRPQICLGACDWRLEARVLRHPENRGLVFTWASLEGDVGSSWIPLVGESSAFLQTRHIRHVAPGEYQIIAAVLSTTGIRGTAYTRAIVGGMH